ncbi:atxn2, partial [Symbiodinium microadriaticum]
LEGPGSVLTALAVALKRRNSGAGASGNRQSGPQEGAAKAAPAKKAGLGPVQRSVFRQYQADMHRKIAEAEAPPPQHAEGSFSFRALLQPASKGLMASRALNGLFVGGAVLIALYSWAVYGALTEWLIPLGRSVHPDMEAAFLTEKASIYLHALTSATALAIGPFQVIPSFRRTHMFGHRWAGRVYFVCGTIGSVTGGMVALKAQGGVVGQVGFMCLSVAWTLSNVIGFAAIAFPKIRSVPVHERAMQISCALAYSAVSLRIMLPVAILTDFQPVYGAIAWLCWTVNLVILEFIRCHFQGAGAKDATPKIVTLEPTEIEAAVQDQQRRNHEEFLRAAEAERKDEAARMFGVLTVWCRDSVEILSEAWSFPEGWRLGDGVWEILRRIAALPLSALDTFSVGQKPLLVQAKALWLRPSLFLFHSLTPIHSPLAVAGVVLGRLRVAESPTTMAMNRQRQSRSGPGEARPASRPDGPDINKDRLTFCLASLIGHKVTASLRNNDRGQSQIWLSLRRAQASVDVPAADEGRVLSSSSASSDDAPRSRPLAVYGSSHPAASSAARERPVEASTSPLMARSVVTVATGADGVAAAERLEAPFGPESLRRELPPDQFLAMAATLGRPYAAPRPENLPAPSQPSTSLVAETSPSVSLPARRYWPAGSRPPSVKPTEAARGSAMRSAPISKPSVAYERGCVSVVEPARVLAKPTPQVRGRGRPVTDASEATATATGTARTPLATEDAQGSMREDVAASAPPEPEPPVTECGTEATVAEPGTTGRITDGPAPPETTQVTNVGHRTVEHAPSQTAVDSQAFDQGVPDEEEEDDELRFLLRRGDLPVQVSVLTGFPAGVAPLVRDPQTRRIRVIRRKGHRLTHGGLVIAEELLRASRERRPSLEARMRLRPLRRLRASGGAIYKGRWRSAQQLGAPAAASDLVVVHPEPAQPRTQKHPPPTAPPLPGHIKALTWNAGGLGGKTGALFDELQIYANRHPFHILFIQETKWTFTNMWEDSHWVFIHSGSPARDFKQGGVLIMLSRRIVDSGSVRYVEPLPGRLLWVYFRHKGQSFDLLNLYQHAWRDSERIRTLRHRALDTLTKSLQAVSLRSILLVAGDFNCQCVQQPPHVGACVMSQAHWSADAPDFQAFVVGNDLVALNTHTQLPKPNTRHTYCWGSQQSQLDYILIRRQHVSGPSKQACVHYNFPLLGLRDGGKHYPVCAQIPLAWRPWHRSRGQPPAPQIDRHAIADALAASSDPRVHKLRAAVQVLVQSAPLTIEELHDKVHAIAVDLFPVKRPAAPPQPCQDSQLQSYAVTMWSHFKAYRKLTAPGDRASAAELFRAWYHKTAYRKMRAAARKHSGALRKLKRSRLFDLAKAAAISGNLREYYKVVRLLAPRGPRTRFQLCQGGKPMAPDRELELMTEHFESQYASHLPPPEENWCSPDAVAVTASEVQWHLDRLPARKAGAPGTAPGAVWRLCSDLVSPLIASQLEGLWGGGVKSVPHSWTTATLALLLKAGKNGSEPKHFRPIGLIDALGKSCISMVLHKIKHDLEEFVRTAPQFSYIAGRSTEDALRRVFFHCAEARLLRDTHARNPHQRFAGHRTPELQGGVQVCLDLASAFDSIPHSLVREALLEAGVDSGPAALLFTWLSSCSYEVHLSGLRSLIVARRGVKQGCPASPLLFAACTVLLARRVDLHLGESWTSKHLTMFADDLHLASLFKSTVELDFTCQRFGAAIRILQAHGLRIQPSKAQALLTFTGSKSKQARHRFTKPLPPPTKGHGLKLRVGGEDVLLPLARRADYLGAVISYDGFAAQTLDKRMTQCRAAHVQLRQVLNNRRGLLLSQRVLLWRTTVLPCLLYGLGASGLSRAQLHTLQTLAMKQLRALSGSPAHLFQESDTSLCLRLGVPLPVDALGSLLRGSLRRQVPGDAFVLSEGHPWVLFLQSCWERSAPAFPAAPAVDMADPPVPPSVTPLPLSAPPGLSVSDPPSLFCPLPLSAVAETLTTGPADFGTSALNALEAAVVSPSPHPMHGDLVDSSGCLERLDRESTVSFGGAAVPPTLVEMASQDLSIRRPDPAPSPPQLTAASDLPFQCPQCPRSFDTRKTLKLHMGRAHKMRTVTIVFDRAKHALGGLPTCAFCYSKFTRWEGLSAHIVNMRCDHIPLSLAFAPKSVNASDTPVPLVVSEVGVSPGLGSALVPGSEAPDEEPVFWACTMVFSPAELDASMEEAFGPIIDTLQYKRQADPPTTGLSRESKSARGDGDPDKTKGAPKGQGWPKGRGRGKTTPTPQGAGGSRGGFGGSGGSQDRAEPPDSLTRVMARALIQQADAIAVLRQSTAWIFFLQTALPSVVPTLGKAAARWRAQVNDEGSEIFGLGLRVVLIWALFNVLRQTLEEPPAELLADARDRKWLNQTGAWVFLRWNRKTKALEPDASRAALNQSDMVKLLKEAGSLADGETVSRFAANRRLEEGMQGRVVPMQMDVQFRSPRAHQLYSTLEQLQGLSALNLLGVSFRKEGYRRPNGIQQLADWCLLWAVQGYVCSAEAFGRIGAAAVRALASKVAPTNIFELRNWKPLLEAWISPSAQHDCAEFLSHVGDRLNSSLLQGCWEARVLEGDRVRVLDTGRCLATIGLDLPAGDSHDLQELIGQWHAQYSAHALHTPPQVLVLRIARYRWSWRCRGSALRHTSLFTLNLTTLASNSCAHSGLASIQEVWDLELPSIFGAAHPSFPDDEEPAADNEWISSSSSGVHQSDDECSAVSVHESQAGSSDAAAASPAILPQGDWGDIWNMDHIDHRYTLRLPSGIMPPLPDAGAPSIELLASVVCQRGWCNLSHLAYLSDNVPQQRSAKRRRSSTCSGTVEGNQRTFSVGAYSIGGCCGVQTNTRTFPWTTRWMCAMVGGVAPCHHFSSCTLLKDVMHFLHRDGGNDARSINLLMPCSRWQGGQIWIADEAGSVHLDATSGPGRLVNISPPFVTIRLRLSPTQASTFYSHAVMYEGTFHSCALDSDYSITLKTARRLPSESNNKSGEVIDMLVISGKDFLQVSAMNVPPPSRESEGRKGFATDAEISGRDTESSRDLVPWNADGSYGQELGGLEDGHNDGKWDQFAVNEQKYGVSSTFNEEYYTTPLDKSSIPAEKREEADQIARQIEAGQTHAEVEDRVDVDGDGDEE